MRPLVLLGVILLAGCAKFGVVKKLTVSADSPAGKNVDANLASSTSKGVAYVMAGRSAVVASPDGIEKQVALGSIDTGLSFWPAPKAEDLAAAMSQSNAGLRGDLDSARAGWAKATNEAEQAKVELVRLRTELEEERRQSAAKIQEAFKHIQDEANSRVMREQEHTLNWIGAAGIALFGVMAGFGGLAGAKRGWIFGAIGLAGFGLAQLVSQSWFMPAVGVTTGLLVLAGIAWAIYEHRQGKLAQALQERAQEAQEALHVMVPVIDKAKEEFTGEAAVGIDALLKLLSQKMDQSHKSTVKAVRAVAP